MHIINFCLHESFKMQKQPPEMFCKKGVLKRPATLLKKRLQHRCFPVKFAKLLRTPALKNIEHFLKMEYIKNLNIEISTHRK